MGMMVVAVAVALYGNYELQPDLDNNALMIRYYRNSIFPVSLFLSLRISRAYDRWCGGRERGGRGGRRSTAARAVAWGVGWRVLLFRRPAVHRAPAPCRWQARQALGTATGSATKLVMQATSYFTDPWMLVRRGAGWLAAACSLARLGGGGCSARCGSRCRSCVLPLPPCRMSWGGGSRCGTTQSTPWPRRWWVASWAGRYALVPQARCRARRQRAAGLPGRALPL